MNHNSCCNHVFVDVEYVICEIYPNGVLTIMLLLKGCLKHA